MPLNLGNSLRGDLQSVAEVAGQRVGALEGGARNDQAPGSEAGEFETFTLSDLDDVEDDPAQGRFHDVLEYVVPAQTGYVWGYGTPDRGAGRNQGGFYAELQDTAGNPITSGKFRLRSRNAVGKDVDDHGTYHLTALNANENDRRTWVPLPERVMDIVGEDSELYIQLRLDQDLGAETIDWDASTVYVDATEFTNV